MTCNAVLVEPFNNLSNWIGVAGGITVAPGRTGTALSIVGSAGLPGVRYSIPAIYESAYATVGFAFFMSAAPTSTSFLKFGSDAGAVTDHIRISWETPGNIRVWRGGTNLATSVGTVSTGVWHYIEAQVRMDDTAGFVTIRVDGAPFVSVSGVDTKNGGTKTTLDSLFLVGQGGITSLFDDLYLNTGDTCAFQGDPAATVTATGTGAVTFGGAGTVTAAWPVIPGPPAGIGWRAFNSWRGPPANRNLLIGELANARSLRLHFDLYGPATATCTLNGRSPAAATLQELSQDLVLYRWNPYAAAYQVMFRGPVGHTQDVLGETTHAVNVAAADYRAMLARRPVGGPLTFTGSDQFTIANELVMGAPPFGGGVPPYDMGISAPFLLDPAGNPIIGDTGVPRDRTYTGAEKTADMVNNLAAVINGFDWGAEPLDPGGATPGSVGAQTYVWYPRRGVTKPFLAEYGTTVASVSRTVDSTTFGNWVRNDGTNDDAGNPLFAVAAGDVVTNPQLHAEGLWPLGVSNPSTSDPTTLAEQAAGALALDSVLVPSYSLTLIPGVWRWKSDCWLGDTIGVRINSGRLNVDTQVRIIQIDFAVDDNGVERATLTVARAVPTLADVLVGQRSELDALSRR
jgi:hypothetical protein